MNGDHIEIGVKVNSKSNDLTILKKVKVSRHKLQHGARFNNRRKGDKLTTKGPNGPNPASKNVHSTSRLPHSENRIEEIPEASVSKRKKKIKRLNVSVGESTVARTEIDQSECQKKKQKRKRKRPKSVSEEEKIAQPGAAAGGAKRRKRRGLKHSADEMENNTNLVQTNVNYPKENSAVAGFSCNWKKLCQTLSVNKPTDVSSRIHQGKNSQPLVKPRRSPSTKKISNDIWFDGVDKDLLEPPRTKAEKSSKENTLVKEGTFKGLTKAVAMDCEMVGTGDNGAESMLARVSIVNLMGNCIYDKYVKPTEPVTDYRTPVSGIRPLDLLKGDDFKAVQKEVSDILDRRILVGHAVHNDLKVLFLTHPRRKIRDTASYKLFKNLNNGNTPSLKGLAEKLLGVKVQEGEHSSVQDAQAAMRLYTMHKIDWEKEIKKKHSKSVNARTKTSSTAKRLPNSPTTRKFSQLKI